MEPANIDWRNIESIFVEDELYEHIIAPKWVDFFAPDDQHVDDEAWFCKPECRHPKTAEEFLRSASKVKHLRSMSASENLPLRDRNLRGGIVPSGSTNRRLNKAKTFKPPDSLREEDQENQNPIQQATPPEKRKPFERSPKLKSTLSASNLFAGRDILNQITEFCSELKKMVMKPKDGESLKKGDGKTSDQKKKLLDGFSTENENSSVDVKEMQVVQKPTPEMAKGEAKLVQNSIEKKPRKLRMNEKENNPILLDMKKVITQDKEQQRLLQVRTNPPSPQCFSGYREPPRKPKQTTPIKFSKSITEEKGVLQEVGQSNRVLKEEVTPKKVGNQSISVAGKEAKSMEMFWILKPCLAK
ncbi:hypothetical protein ACHQM5_012377 [Ranunculus cassubicifolius]